MTKVKLVKGYTAYSKYKTKPILVQFCATQTHYQSSQKNSILSLFCFDFLFVNMPLQQI